MLLAVWAMKPGFMIRPQLFSFVFFSLYLLVFYLFFNRRLSHCLIWLPIMMVFWVNLHGGFLIGGALIAVIVMWESLSHLFRGQRARRLRLLWGWAVATAGVVFINPYGYKLLLFLYRSLSTSRNITEWMPITLYDTSFLQFKILGIAVLAMILLRGKQNQGWEVAVLLFTGLFALKHQRNLVFFAIAAAPYLADGISTGVAAVAKIVGRPKLSAAFPLTISVVFASVAAGHLYLGSRVYVQSRFGIVVDPRTYPVTAVDFIRYNRFQGNLFVHFDWGEYALWKLYPACRVSIDGRFRTVYPESVIRDHFIPGDDVKALNRVVSRYPADILLYPRTPFTTALMQNGSDWVYVYSDPLAFVFLRRNAKNKERIRQFETVGFKHAVVRNPYAFP
jgi:hypothetical protein